MKLIQSELFPRCLHWVLIPTIAVGMTLWPTLSSGLGRLQNDAGDTMLNLYFLEHAFQHFRSSNFTSYSTYWSPNFFWPVNDTLTWSDHLLGPSAIYACFRIFFDKYQSYVGWLFATLWFNYTSIRFAASRICPETNPIWMSITALITAFSPTIIQQLGHPQLLSLFLIGPILIQCHKLICFEPKFFSLSHWALLATFALANGFFNIYTFVYACYGILACAIVHIFKRFRYSYWKLELGSDLFIKTGLLSACIALNVLIYTPYLQALKTFGERPYSEILHNLPKPASWLYSSQNWLLTGPITPNNINTEWIYGAEQQIFPGWVMCMLMGSTIVTALIYRKRHDSSNLILWIAVVVLMNLGTLSLNNLSAWPTISMIFPGASALRASSRVALMIVFFTPPSIILASKYWHIESLSFWKHLLAVCTLLVGSFAGIWGTSQPAFSLTDWKKEQKSISKAIVDQKCKLFWYEWSDQAPWRAQVIAMHAQLETGIATLNGYSGQFPKENWSLNSPFGQTAYLWAFGIEPKLYHSTKKAQHQDGLCIVNYSDQEQVRVRQFDLSKKSNLEPYTISKPGKIVLSKSGIKLTEKYFGLYFQISEPMTPGIWTMLVKDGMPIPAFRGDFKITNVYLTRGKNRKLIIIDTNEAERLEYRWEIEPGTGIFIRQSIRQLAKD